MMWEEGPLTPTAQERQAQALRHGLDHELAAIQATAQARERLVRASTARTRAGHSSGWGPRNLRPALALPLAGALVAAVIAAAVVVPTFLQADPGTTVGVPATGGPPSDLPSLAATPDSTPTSAPAPTPREPSAVAVPRPESTPDGGTISPAEDPSTAPPLRAGLRLIMKPTAPKAEQRATLTVLNIPERHGEITVNWADGSADTTLPGNCDRKVPAAETSAETIGHVFKRAGKYQVRLIIDLCESRGAAELTVGVEGSDVSPIPAD